MKTIQGRSTVNGNLNPSSLRLSLRGYAAGAMLASLVFISWIFFVVSAGSDATKLNPGARLGFALFFWLASGFAPTLLGIALPWALAVFIWRKQQWPGQIYFPAIGAILVFVIGSGIASLMPKPLFVEDQTFLEGAVIFAQRAGICLLFAGMVFGVSYWFIGERRIPARRTNRQR